ncbi:MAG: hypothetical protein WBE37_10040 [Bryobacteraceae bacterium]
MQKSTKGKTVTFPIDVWYDAKSGRIHVATNDAAPEAGDYIIAVSNDPKKANGHPTLFKRLRKILQAQGAPAPPDDPEPDR